jgi:hypothetical protein
MKVPLLLALLLFSARAVSAGFDYSAYQPAELADVTNSIADEVDPRADYWFDASHPKYNSVVTLTGKRRPIAPGLKDFISKWVRTMGHPASDIEMFQTEIEVSQGSTNYWVPIQQQLLEPLDTEVTAGEEVRLYILVMGAYLHTPVFSVAEFAAAASNTSFTVTRRPVTQLAAASWAPVHHAPQLDR